MSVTSEDFGTAMVVRIAAARLDAASAEAVRGAAERCLAGGRAVYLLDMDRVAAVDEVGLGTLVALLRRAGRARLELCGLTPAVRRALRHTRLDRVFTLHPTAAGALRAHLGLPVAGPA